MFGNQTAREAARAQRLEQLEKWRAEELKERQAKLSANGGIPITGNAAKSRRAEENLDDPSKPRFSVDLTFLMAVRDRDVAFATRLLKKGANVKAVNQYGHTPLHLAVTNDDRAMVEFLINNGSDIEARDQDGWTPLHAAAHWGSNKGGCRHSAVHTVLLADARARARMCLPTFLRPRTWTCRRRCAPDSRPNPGRRRGQLDRSQLGQRDAPRGRRVCRHLRSLAR